LGAQPPPKTTPTSSLYHGKTERAKEMGLLESLGRLVDRKLPKNQGNQIGRGS
jgi:hypothetical protein